MRDRRQPNDVPVDTAPPAPSRADAAEKVFTWAIFAYSAVRVIPVWRGLEDGSVNPWVFLAIDLGTAYPYAKSWPRLIRSLAGHRLQTAVFWALVLVGSFLAPYLYVALAGDDVAGWVWWLLGVFIAIGLVSAAHRLRSALRKGSQSDDSHEHQERRLRDSQ